MKFTVNEMLARLPLPADDRWKEGVWDLEPFENAGVTLVFFAPRGRDYQTSHEKDELYFIARGIGDLIVGDGTINLVAGDVFFVEAKVEHHFENFSADFATWAVFF